MDEEKPLFELLEDLVKATGSINVRALDSDQIAQLESAIKEDPAIRDRLRATTRNLLLLTEGVRLVKAELDRIIMREESAGQYRLNTTRKHFVRWVEEFAGMHDFDQVFDGEPYFHCTRSKKGLVRLYLVTNKRKLDITDETMPAAVIRVVEPRPGEIKVTTIRELHDDIAKRRYDELLTELEREYHSAKSPEVEAGSQNNPGRNSERDAEICRLKFEGPSGITAKEITVAINKMAEIKGWDAIKQERVEQIYRADKRHNPRSAGKRIEKA